MKKPVEMPYLSETPVILDDTKAQANAGAVQKTSFEEGIRKALAWMRNLTSRS
jgi:nucleoside-diphosphate-sugar epimerase